MGKKRKIKVAYVAAYSTECSEVKVFVVNRDGTWDYIRDRERPLPTLNSLATVYRVNLEKYIGVIEERRIYEGEDVYILHNMLYLSEGELVREYVGEMRFKRQELGTDEMVLKVIGARDKLARQLYKKCPFVYATP